MYLFTKTGFRHWSVTKNGGNHFIQESVPIGCHPVKQFAKCDNIIGKIKPFFCICQNKGADQLRSNCTADQRLCFCNTDSTIPLLPKYKISTL